MDVDDEDIDDDFYGRGDDGGYTFLTRPEFSTNGRLDAAARDVGRAAQMVTYGEHFSTSNRSSAESNSTLPDRPSMTGAEIMEFMDDAVAHFTEMIRNADSAQSMQKRVSALQDITVFNHHVWLTDDQIQLLRGKPELKEAVIEMLFEAPQFGPDDWLLHLEVARDLIPIFDIPQDTIIRFVVREWGSHPTPSSSYTSSEFRNGMVRVTRPTKEEDTILRQMVAKTIHELVAWVEIALPDSHMVFVGTMDPLIRATVDAFRALGGQLDPSSACINLMIQRMIDYDGITTSTPPYVSLPLLAMQTNEETAIVYGYLFPRVLELESRPRRPFRLTVAFTNAFRARASAHDILSIMELALVTGITDTDPAVREKFALGRDGAMDILDGYGLMYGNRFVLEATGFIDKLMRRHKVVAGAPLPEKILLTEMERASPRLWQWLIKSTRNRLSKKKTYYALVDDAIRAKNQLWMPVS